MVANGKRRKTRIYRLEQEEGIIEGEEKLEKYVTKYYKNLFGKSERNNISLDETRKEDIIQVQEEENMILVEEFRKRG